MKSKSANESIPNHCIMMSSVLNGHVKMPDKQEFQSLQSNHRHSVDDGVIPYDSSRVILKNKIRGSDFVNASWMVQHKEEGSYDLLRPFHYAPFEETSFIIAEAPTSKTNSAFYQMIGQEKVDIVLSFQNVKPKEKVNVGEVCKMDRVSKTIRSSKMLTKELQKRIVLRSINVEMQMLTFYYHDQLQILNK